ncbi:TPA: hypothetical protein DCP13_01790 [Candidatus Azambacteria bacterium]|uniref:Uncharacterized protein n=2 Tax=Candidatus Azamiibacteriota TaxID=1752741 RepID=A0A0G1T3K0_9BACT|nr:MAG: hypothetical protein UX51_C0006G0004 [Candidatus Azambacteria bacterium GW2011_GWF2_46_32]KKU40015.1 MAG: hypothetical protein UX56_C0045G0003 [Candidatus Azambacteria bacterium GW2011_GWD2_46_48]HAM95941.1 hypothetical protein [Candidatus Azambacteria bacterium]HAQ05512.1 hypothetical protein [Candidatus Azambacteria bacterium]HBA52688.1 hypothetical protein [Candidatus Azambacteria bacterium]
MKNQRGFIKIPILIAIIAGILVVVGAGYIVAKKVNNPEQVIPSEEVLKNSNEDSTTTPAVDANSIFLKEEMARKKQRDIDREQCIASVIQYDPNSCKASAFSCATIRAREKERVNEETDRCYFRFPTN